MRGPTAIFVWVVATSAMAAGNAAPSVKQLEPTTAWRVDYGDERCSLAQQYGSGSDGALLEIDSYGSRNQLFVTLVGNAAPQPLDAVGSGAYRFPGDPNGREAQLYRGTAPETHSPSVSFAIRFTPYDDYQRRHNAKGKAQQRQLRLEPEQIFPDYERTIDAIGLALGPSGNVQLNVHAIAAPLTALRTCVDNLRKSWGLDPAVQRTLSRPPVLDEKDIGRLAGAFPAAMIRNGQSALLLVRLMVDATGKATSCVIQTPIIEPTLKTAVCSSLTHFEPALDAAGKPVASVYTNSLTFRTPV